MGSAKAFCALLDDALDRYRRRDIKHASPTIINRRQTPPSTPHAITSPVVDELEDPEAAVVVLASLSVGRPESPEEMAKRSSLQIAPNQFGSYCRTEPIAKTPSKMVVYLKRSSSVSSSP